MKKIVSTSDGEIAVAEVWGDVGTDLPIVLIHGLSQQRNFWLPTITRTRHRPIIAVDLRGHGDADVPESADFSVTRCATDVVEILDDLAVEQAVIVGHSWGASVALHVAAKAPERCTAAVLLDGGVFGPWDQGSDVRERLTPPQLNIPAEQLWAMMQTGPLGANWSPEIQAALQPTFIEVDGRVRTRLGMRRHMAVLDGLLAYRPAADIARLSIPTWVVICEQTTPEWVASQNRGISGIPPHAPVQVQRWGGATHDVPLQWPWMTAGLLDTVVTQPGPKEHLSDRT
jgi:pimeloyl-ACP methyl ester carboxylesterase